MKMKTIQRAFAWALTLVMVLSVAPLGVSAEGEEEQMCICTEKCGEAGNAECPVCSEDVGHCTGVPQKQEDAGKEAVESVTTNVVLSDDDGKTASTSEGDSTTSSGNDSTNGTGGTENQGTLGDNSTGGGTGGDTSNGTGNGSSESGEGDSGTQPGNADKGKNGTDGTGSGGTGENSGTDTGSEKKTHKITFDTQGKCDAPQEMTTGEDGKLSQLPAPTADGFTFGGWYLDNGCSDDKEVKQDHQFTGDTTLYAKWTAKPGYTVAFDYNGAESSVNSYTTDNFGKLSNLPEPKREGFIFLGWYNGETKVDVNHTYTEDTTLMAKWSRDVQSITVNKGEGISAPEGFLEGIEIAPNVETIEIAAKRQGNDGLKDKLKIQIKDFDTKNVLEFDLSVETQKADGTKIGNLEEVSKLIQFTFENIPGNGIQVFRLHDGELQELHESGGTAEGYRYSDGTLTIWANRFSPYAIVVNPVAVTITFDPMGGTVDPKTMTTGTDGKLKDALPTPTRPGYTFDGWYSDKNYTGNKITQDVTFLRDSTVYAKWTPKTYTVTFHDNYSDPEVTSQQTFTYDVAQNLNCGSTIHRDYYSLTGWAETQDGAKKFDPNQTVQSLIPEGNKDLYALWTYEPRRVTFDADGGTIKKDGAKLDQVTVNTQEDPINTVKAADVPVPELREGYYFGGWYTRKDGKGDLVKTGEAKEPTVFTADATVYAYWIKFEPVTVTFKCQGGTARIGSTDVKEFTMQTKWPGVLDGTPTTPSRSSYKFEGWYTAAGVKVDENTLFLRDTTVYARWKRAVSITGNPRTGDQVKLEAAIGILAAAAIGLGATVVLKKRKEK